MLELILSKQDQSTNHGAPSLDEIARQGARQLLAKALQEEVKEYLNSTAHERDHKGHRQVVRNGFRQGKNPAHGNRRNQAQSSQGKRPQRGAKFFPLKYSPGI